MRNFAPCLRSRLLARVAAVALASGSVAACSSDSSRFGEDPFSNPFSSASASDPAPRASRSHQADSDIPTGAVRAAPASRVERSPLGAPSATQSRPMYGYGGNSGGSYQSSRMEPRSTGSIGAPRTAPVSRPDPNWSSSGGTMVTLGQGETIHTIAQRYGVPASAIMRANGFTSADAVGEGRQVLIPTYSASAGGYRSAAAPVTPVEPKAFGARTNVEASRPVVDVAVATPARPVAPRPVVVANAPAMPAKPKMQFISGPQPRGAEFKTAEVRAPEVRAPEARVQVRAPQVRAPEIKAPEIKTPEIRAQIKAPEIKAPQPKTVEVKTVEVKTKIATAQAPALAPAPVKTERAFAAAPAKLQAPSSDDNVKTAALKVESAPASEPAGPSFRWPARGRVISGYGSKTSGASNDGVNIAVPEGTEIKASDDGVVAYSGSELKGFGNLVLIRHSNGWVTAYAHNSALNVKRGETVRRGQIIAKSGSTGSVSSPQLHFEVRKGAQTVDPLKHLPDT